MQGFAYHDLKDRGLSAQPALHVLRKVADAYTALRGVRFVCSERARKLLSEHREGETDLVHRDGMWLLIATCEIGEAEPTEPDGFIGVDLGIANIATTSTGYRAVGRRLKHRRRKEQRHAANVNHIISKRIVTEALGHLPAEGWGRVTLHSWAFAQLGRFLEYKGRRACVALVYVDPTYTSQECAQCHHVEKENRVNQARFICRSCGVVAHADRNASHNIAQRGETVWNAGRESRVPATP